MFFTWWFVVVGVLLIGMALAGSMLKGLPLTAAMFYLAAGVLLGPAGAGLIRLDPIRDAALIERITEIAVVISLFTAGLKLRLPFSDPRWRPPLRLAILAMALTVGAIAAVGAVGLGLSIGAAVLLGAILAPTDPVLASDVQVEHPHDAEAVRFSLTGEAGLNDGTAFPFVMLGLGLLGLHEIGPWGLQWVAGDVLWAVPAGLGTGALWGTLLGRLVIYLRRVHREAVGLDDFLALGLIALSYGTALLVHGYGFLAVFAAGLALRRIERQETGTDAPRDVTSAAASTETQATDTETAPAYMAQAVLRFNEQLERLAEFAVVLLVGGMVSTVSWSSPALWLTFLLLVVIRPITTFLSLLGTHMSVVQRAFIAWFGIRGIGSIYYLSYSVGRGLDAGLARSLADFTLVVVAVSIVVHGVSVTPLMRRYAARREARTSRGGHTDRRVAFLAECTRHQSDSTAIWRSSARLSHRARSAAAS